MIFAGFQKDHRPPQGNFAKSLDQQVHLIKSIDKVRPEYMI